MKNKKEIKEKLVLVKYTEFKFAYIENAQNLSQAVELGGYFAKISKRDSSYLVEIYTSRF